MKILKFLGIQPNHRLGNQLTELVILEDGIFPGNVTSFYFSDEGQQGQNTAKHAWNFNSKVATFTEPKLDRIYFPTFLSFVIFCGLWIIFVGAASFKYSKNVENNVPEKNNNFFLKVFAYQPHWAKVCSSKRSKKAIKCLDGIRTISTFWVMLGPGIHRPSTRRGPRFSFFFLALVRIGPKFSKFLGPFRFQIFKSFWPLLGRFWSVKPLLGHFYLQIGFTRNSENAISQMKNGEYSAIFGATVSVDSFFCIGGLLLAYLSTNKILKSFNTFRRHMFQ